MDQEVKQSVLWACTSCFARLGVRETEVGGKLEVHCYFKKEEWSKPVQVSPCRMLARYAPTEGHVREAKRQVRAIKCSEPRLEGVERRSEPRKQ